jgi:hypothetical protein
MRMLTGLCLGLTLTFLAGSMIRGADPVKPAEPGTLIVIDANGKEQKLKSWKFAAGTRHLGWLAPIKEPKGSEGTPNDKGPGSKPAEGEKAAGPEYLELREENSTDLVQGILTAVAIEQIRAIDFDNTKETVAVTVATSDKPEYDVVLTGSTAFKGVNKWTIECEVDKGDLGIAAVKFLCGVPKGIQGIRFPPPRLPARAAAGRSATVTGNDSKKDEHKVADLQALYAVEGGQKLVPTLFFKTTLKVDLGRIRKVVVPTSKNKGDQEWDVTFKDGDSNTLTLITDEVKLDGKPAVLLGLVGKVPVGFKLFHLPAIAEIQLEEPK